MNYQNSHLLLALFAIAIPIIIHLFNFRKYKTVRFSSNRFLEEIVKKRKKHSQLKNLLILLSRILAVIFLVLAFAKPYIPSTTQNTQIKDVFIYIDNSFSMDAIGTEGRLIDVAKQKAESIINTYSADYNFWLITNDFKSLHSRAFNKKEIKVFITDIQPTALFKSIEDIISRKQSLTNNANHLYLISDFQASTALSTYVNNTDSSAFYFFIPLAAQKTNNISIDSIWMNTPVYMNGEQIELSVVVQNHSNTLLKDISTILTINNKQKSQQLLNMKALEEKVISFNFICNEDEDYNGLVSIQNHPITFDNDFYFSFVLNTQTKILCINDDKHNKYIDALFNTDTNIHIYNKVAVHQLDFNQLEKYNLIILNEINNPSSGLIYNINNFVDNGGSVMLIPPANLDFEVYQDWLSSISIDYYTALDSNQYKLDEIEIKHPIFSQVFEGEISHINYPSTNTHYQFSNQNKIERHTLFTLENNDAFINQYQYKKGIIYLFSTPLNDAFTDFSKHALFVPTLLNMANLSVGKQKLYYTIGKDKYINTTKRATTNNVYHLSNNTTNIIPSVRAFSGKRILYIDNQINEAGHYKLHSAERTLQNIAFNYPYIESNTKCLTTKELASYLKKHKLYNFSIISAATDTFEQNIEQQQKGTHYWKYALLLALIFLATEIVLIKFIKP